MRRDHNRQRVNCSFRFTKVFRARLRSSWGRVWNPGRNRVFIFIRKRNSMVHSSWIKFKNFGYYVSLSRESIVFKLTTGTGTIIFNVNKGDCVEGEYLDSRFALVKNGENWEQTLSINGELKDWLVSPTEPAHGKIELWYYNFFQSLIKKYAINDQPTKWSLPQTTSSLTTTSTPTTNCIGFEMLPTNLTASRSDAKRICRLLGGELPYFENQVYSTLKKF